MRRTYNKANLDPAETAYVEVTQGSPPTRLWQFTCLRRLSATEPEPRSATQLKPKRLPMFLGPVAFLLGRRNPQLVMVRE